MNNLNSDLYEFDHTSELETNQKMAVRVNNITSFIIDSI